MGPAPAQPPAADALADLRHRLRHDVEHLSLAIGPRHVWRYVALLRAQRFVEESLAQSLCHVHHQHFHVHGREVANLEVEVRGTERPAEVLVVGAHYDSRVGDAARPADPAFPGTPGADDNATGVAAVLALARMFARRRVARTLRFVAFVNEEPPFFQTPDMGSVVYARRCRERGERIIGMLTPETLGYYTDLPHSQRYPFPYGLALPSTGNFIALLSNYGSRRLLRTVATALKRHCAVPVLAAWVPAVVRRIGWSDDWSFWREGYEALAVTDTAYLRNRAYHTPQDTPEKLDFDRMAQVVAGLAGAIGELAEA